MKLKLLNVVILTLTVISCTTYTVTPLPLPSESLVKPTEASLSCLSDEAYTLVVKSFKRVKTLEGIIKSTH